MIKKMWKWIKPYLDPKMLPIILTVWILTNGIWYIIAFVNIFPDWLMKFAKGYIIFLWMPFSMEKPLVIIPLSMLIYKIIYKKNFKGE